MQVFFLIFIYITISSCSFDNKTGIWKDASNTTVETKATTSIKDNNLQTRYENIYSKDESFNEEIIILDNSSFQLDPPIRIENWLERHASPKNNIPNFLYAGNNLQLLKSSKLSKGNNDRDVLFYKNNLISYDHKGKIFIYSLSLKKKIFEFDFYKKTYKKYKKEIYLILRDNTLYAADNLGYIYAINLTNESLIWAKNFGIPFRSNIKFTNEQIFLASQDNVIYSINISNGEKKWQFATGQTFLKSDFNNSLALNKPTKSIIFLNTSGELYSINYLTQDINWVLNFKNSSMTEDTDLFLSHSIIMDGNNLIVSTEKAILSFNIVSALKNWNFPSSTILKPILTTNYTYVLSKNKFLICIDNITGKALWSKNIYNDLNEKRIKNKIGQFHDFKIVNNEINLFSNNGYLLVFDYSNGNFKSIKKISKSGINSEVVFIKENMFFIDSKNRLLKFN